MKTMLVKNIRFNDNQPFELKIPDVYYYPSLAKHYIRTTMFNVVEIDYDFEELKIDGRTYITDAGYDDQDYDVNVMDDSVDLKHSNYLITAMHASSAIVIVEDSMILVPDDVNDMRQAIYEILAETLPVRFLYKQID